MANSWITHVRQFAQSRGITYASALSDPDIRTGYVKKAPAPRAPKSSSSDGGATAKLALKKLRADEKQMMKEQKKAEGVAKRLALVESKLTARAIKKAEKAQAKATAKLLKA